MSNAMKGASPADDLLKNSSLYREFQAEREEILKHKWIESEKAGYDLGDHAVWDWVQKYAHEFREYWQKKNSS